MKSSHGIAVFFIKNAWKMTCTLQAITLDLGLFKLSL